jgi:hypothetical protein
MQRVRSRTHGQINAGVSSRSIPNHEGDEAMQRGIYN